MKKYISKHKNSLINIGLWTISFLCLGYILMHVDFVHMWSAIKSYPPIPIGFLVLWMLGVFVATTLRKYLLFSGRISLKKAFKSSLLCIGGNNIFPARAGDFIHAIYLLKTANIPRAETLSILFWERFADLHILTLFSLFALSFFDPAFWVFILILCIIFGIWIGLFILYYKPQWIFFILGCIPWKKPLFFAQQFSIAIQSRYGIRWILYLIVGTILIWSCIVAVSFFAFTSVAHLNISTLDALCVSCAICISVLIPAPPGNIGVFEASVVFILGLFKVNRSEALAIGLVCHSIFFVIPLLGLILAVCIDKQAKTIVEEVEFSEHEDNEKKNDI